MSENKKKWLLIHPFDYISRTNILEEILTENSIEYFNVVSDYSHIRKQFLSSKERHMIKNRHVIKTIGYKKNISVMRILSHIWFSIKTLLFIRKEKPEIIYCRIPPNTLVFFIAKFSRCNRVIFDVYDLWPESMPGIGNKYKFFTDLWKKLRDQYLSNSSLVITECDYFKKFIKISGESKNMTIYPCSFNVDDQNDYGEKIVNKSLESTLNLAYLGTINNIVDLEAINELLKTCKRKFGNKINLYFIGKGESKTKLADICEKNHIEFVDCGVIYDNAEKKVILDKCHFGLNLFKSNTIIGLSLKSIEYFRFGLPI
ncbi:TPA: hypothetical protein ACG79H_002568, partial [Enterococcus faecium]